MGSELLHRLRANALLWLVLFALMLAEDAAMIAMIFCW